MCQHVWKFSGKNLPLAQFVLSGKHRAIKTFKKCRFFHTFLAPCENKGILILVIIFLPFQQNSLCKYCKTIKKYWVKKEPKEVKKETISHDLNSL